MDDAAVAKYKQIATQIKTKTPDAKKSATTIADNLTVCNAGGYFATWDPLKDDAIDVAKDCGDVAPDMSDIFFEEPMVVQDEDEEATGEERSLWGDGQKNPEDAEE